MDKSATLTTAYDVFNLINKKDSNGQLPTKLYINVPSRADTYSLSVDVLRNKLAIGDINKKVFIKED